MFRPSGGRALGPLASGRVRGKVPTSYPGGRDVFPALATKWPAARVWKVHGRVLWP